MMWKMATKIVDGEVVLVVDPDERERRIGIRQWLEDSMPLAKDSAEFEHIFQMWKDNERYLVE